MKYFSNIRTEKSATRRWHELAKKYHPDIVGNASIETWHEIQHEYQQCLRSLESRRIKRCRRSCTRDEKVASAETAARHSYDVEHNDSEMSSHVVADGPTKVKEAINEALDQLATSVVDAAAEAAKKFLSRVIASR
ncbi:MAG: hypothetical protein HYX66_08855 [Ignavibacteria bacterium]|nr:hypothetical protein [Ignavibacteria bacterium]